jgi:hypothetical protein
VVVIGFLLDLQLPMQSVSITTNAVSSHRRDVLDTTLCDNHDIAKILRKVVLKHQKSNQNEI